MGNLPWLRPGIVISVLIAMALGSAVSRALGTSRAVGTLLIASFGFVVSATLTPLRMSFESGVSQGLCDMSRLWPATPDLLLSVTDASLNVVLFVPLGIAVGLLPRSSGRIVVMVGAIALPFYIELTQLLVTPLMRGCQSSDVIDNLTGLFIGWIGAALARRAWSLWQASRISSATSDADGA